MKKLFTILAFSLFTAAMPALAQSSGSYQVKSSGGANLRQSPSTSASINTSIPQGAKVRVVEKRSDGWYKVEYNGKTGYVAGELIEPDNGSSPTNQANNNPQPEKKPATQSSSNQAGTRNNSNSSNSQRQASKKKSTASSSGANRNWGIGLRLGEPAGLTVKKYLSSNHALEVSLGRSARWGYSYNEEDFYKHDDWNDRDYYHYAGYKGGFSTALQVHYLWQKPIASAKGLNWYVGLGGQARFTPIRYYYYYNDGSWDKDWQKWHYVEERRTDIDLGVDGVVGLEYTIPSAPVSIFADVNLFLEIVDTPFFAAGQGGIGIRYNF